MRLADEWSPEDATFAHVDLSVAIAVLGLLMVWAGWAAARGRLKRNYVIGMRTGTIMRTDATWRAAHKKCAWCFWSSGLVMLATSGVIFALRPPPQWTLAFWILMSVYLAVAVLMGFNQADKEARTVM
jgi:hypothetical protein